MGWKHYQKVRHDMLVGYVQFRKVTTSSLGIDFYSISVACLKKGDARFVR